MRPVSVKTIVISLCVAFAAVAFLSSCSFGESGDSSKTSAAQKSPFSKHEMNDTRKAYRVAAYGSSMDTNVAKNIALLKCRTELSKKASAANIEENNEKDGESKKTVVIANLKNTSIVKEKVLQDKKTKKYTYWILMEMPKE